MLQTFVDTHRGVEGVACGRSVFVLKDESEASEGVVWENGGVEGIGCVFV